MRVPRFTLPEDAIFMREAVGRACERIGRPTASEREDVAACVHSIAQAGFARYSDGTIDVGALAEAALLRFWSARGRKPTPVLAA